MVWLPSLFLAVALFLGVRWLLRLIGPPSSGKARDGASWGDGDTPSDSGSGDDGD